MAAEESQKIKNGKFYINTILGYICNSQIFSGRPKLAAMIRTLTLKKQEYALKSSVSHQVINGGTLCPKSDPIPDFGGHGG